MSDLNWFNNNLDNQTLYGFDIFCLIPEIFAVFSILFMLFFSVILYKKPLIDYPNSRPRLFLTICNLLLFCLFILFVLYMNLNVSELFIFNSRLFISESTSFIKLILVLMAFLIFLLIKDYYRYQTVHILDYEFPILIFLSITSFFFVISTQDFVILFFSIELYALLSYVLVAYNTNSIYSTESGIKYFIIGSFSSCILLAGISLLYGSLGSTNFSDIQLLLSLIDNKNSAFYPVILALILITCGLFFKLAAVPFHMWSPDAYDGAPLIVTAYLIVLPKLGLIFFICRLYYNYLLPLNFIWSNLFLVSGLLSLIIGSLGAIWQIKLKRLFIYSTIVNVGYFLLSLSVAANITIVQNIFIYLVFYSLVTIGIFCCLHLFRSYSNFHFVDRITLLNNLSFTNPTLAILFSILLFSLIGLPPFILFFSKFILLSSLISDYILLFVFVILLCLSVYYYLRIIKIMFFFRKSYFLFLLPQSRTLTILLSSIVCVIMLAPFFIDVFVVCLQNGFFNF